MNKYDESGGDDEQSEDGQLSPEDDIDSHEEGDTADSLDIKPPQANRIDSNRYNNKEKKTSKEKKHSRDRRHRERERGVGVGGGEQHDRRRRHRTDNRYHGFSGGRPGVPVSGKAEREIGRYEQPPIRDPREREHYRGGPKDREKDKFRADRDKERDRERRKDSPEKSDADRMLEDLRSRLLSKRSKFESDKRHDDRIPQGLEYENRRIEKEINRYEYESRREKEADRRNQYYHRENREHYRERKQMVELIDSPENYGDNQPMNHKIYKDNRHSRQMTIEDKEQAARRAKLIEADREMARRKELAREELEARRELRRERDETKTSSESPDLPKKRRLSSKEEEMKNIIVEVENIDQNVVMVSDNSEDDTESEYGSSSHTEEEREEEYESKDEVSDGELPGSPLSIGELTKSDIRHASRSGSISSRSQSRSKSRSLSKSKSLSQSPQSRSVSRSPRNRSKSKTPENDENKEQPKQEEEVPVKVEEKPEEKEELPPYFPAAQGCRSVEEFQCLNRIEEGTYGVVYRAKDKRTDEIVALKRLKMEKEKEGFPITSLREINTLLKGQHPNIVTVREIVVGSNMDKIFIVMDYVEHDLKSLMETMKYKKQVFLPGEVKCLTQQLLRAVAHLHDNWILHRDLKTSNLLLSHKGILKVGDFGLAREYGSPLKAYTSIVVTLWYRAPELLLCCKEYSIPIDMWSVGCIFAEFLAMNALFPGKSEIDQLNRIFKDLGTPNERIWPGYNELPAVQKMTFTEYPVSNLRKKFSHFTSEIGLSLLQGLLTYDPKQRLTAEQALKSSYFKELPLPIDPAMFPTWPAKSEIGLFKALSTNIKPPSGGDEFKKLAEFENREEQRWGASMMAESRQMAMGPGFSLKF